MSTKYELLSDCEDLSIGDNDNDTSINPLYSLDLGSGKDDKINKATGGRISKNVDSKVKKSTHNHLFSPLKAKNEIISRP